MSEKQEFKRPSKSRFMARRAGALALTVTALTGISEAATHTYDAVANRIVTINKDNQMLKTYSQPGLAEHLAENHLSPANIKIHYVQPGENSPIAVANNLHAENVLLVSSEIAGQVGGAHNMQLGEAVAIPEEQLRSSSASGQK